LIKRKIYCSSNFKFILFSPSLDEQNFDRLEFIIQDILQGHITNANEDEFELEVLTLYLIQEWAE